MIMTFRMFALTVIMKFKRPILKIIILIHALLSQGSEIITTSLLTWIEIVFLGVIVLVVRPNLAEKDFFTFAIIKINNLLNF